MASGQAFCLKLNSHSNHLIQSFGRLYHDQSMVDCTISCQGGILKCHKLILSSCSPYFSNIFESFTNPYQYPVVVIKDMSLATLKIVIEFMYKGEVTIPQAILASVLEAAKDLQVTGLCDIKIANFQTKPVPGRLSMSLSSEKKRKYSASSASTKNGFDTTKTVVETVKDTEEAEVVDGDDVQDEDCQQDEVGNDTIEEAEVVQDEEEDDEEGDQIEDQEMDNEVVDEYDFDLSLEPSESIVQLNDIPSVVSKKEELRSKRIERLQQDVSSGGVSGGRKIWTDEEITSLIRTWDEESARVWASAGSKTFSMKRISESLQVMGMDRDVSQVEGKIKSIRRDWKSYKSGRAIPQVFKRISPFLEQLKSIFERDERQE